MESLKGVSGIYKITNRVTGKVYIGAAKDIGRRWQQHKGSLIKGNHHSQLLQRSWNKHGKEAFDFELLECVENYYKDANDREEYWIAYFDSANPEKGYNMIARANMASVVAEFNRKRVYTDEMRQKMREVQIGKEQTGKAAKGEDNFNAVEYSFQAPDGTIYTGRNIALFADKHGLCRRSMANLNNGDYYSHKGWTKYPPIPEKVGARFRLLSPDGVLHEGQNLSRFAREHGLAKGGLSGILTSKIASHKGWTNPDSTFKAKPGRGRKVLLVSPDGVVHETESINSFAEKHGLDKAAIHRVICGKNKSHKGWTIPEDKFQPKTGRSREFEIQGPDGRIYKSKGIKTFAKDHGLNPAALHRVITGKNKTHLGWKLPNSVSEVNQLTLFG